MRKYYYLISFILFALILNGCSSSYFYQVYETRLPDNVNMKDGKLYYEDQNCQITYNLWGDKGVIGFSFYNKSDKNIYINLEECFFVKNGVAYDYYKNGFNLKKDQLPSENVQNLLEARVTHTQKPSKTLFKLTCYMNLGGLGGRTVGPVGGCSPVCCRGRSCSRNCGRRGRRFISRHPPVAAKQAHF